MSAFFYIWETVDFPIVLSAEDGSTVLDGIQEIVVSFGQMNSPLVEKYLSKGELTTEDDTVNVHLSQEDTSKFSPGNVVVQVNLYYNGSERDTTATGTIEARNNLHKRLMPNG